MAVPTLLTDANLAFGLLPAPLSRGSKSDAKNTGKFPVYDPNSGGVTATMTSMASGHGLIKTPYSILFDGVNDFVDTTRTVTFENTTARTWVFWATPDSVADQTIFSVHDDGSNYFRFGLTSLGRIRFGVAHSANPEDKWESNSSVYAGGTKYMIAAVMSAGDVTLYLNGSAVSLALDDTYAQGLKTYTDTMQIGGRNSAGTERFAGKLHGAIVYDRALSGAEISTLYTLTEEIGGSYGYENGDGATMELFDSEQSVGQWSTYGVDILMIARQNGADQMTGNYATYPDSNDDGTPDYQLAFSGSWTAGSGYRKADRLIRFPGSPASMTTGGYHPTINNDSIFSVRARIKPTLGALMVVASQYDSATLRWYAWISATGQLYFYFQNATGNRTALSSTTMADGVDADVEWRKRGAHLSLYLNGSEVSYTTQETFNIGAFSFTNPTTIGQAAAAQYLTGDLYFLEIGNKALAADRRSTYADLDNWMGLKGENNGNVMDIQKLPNVSVRTTPFRGGSFRGRSYR